MSSWKIRNGFRKEKDGGVVELSDDEGVGIDEVIEEDEETEAVADEGEERGEWLCETEFGQVGDCSSEDEVNFATKMEKRRKKISNAKQEMEGVKSRTH